MSSQLTQQEKQAYILLSELFLDTEHTPSDLSHLSAALRPLGIPAPRLEHMLRYDLFPILSPNLISITGAWDRFDEAWLLQQIRIRRESETGRLKGIIEVLGWHSLGRRVSSLWVNVKEGLVEDIDTKL